VAELAATFDAMLDRLAEAVETQKRFVANASHELRTPLAVMRTEVDVTLDDPEADLSEYRRMARVVRDASERANGLVEALLVLARSEAQSGRRLVRKVETDLAGGAAAALAAMDREINRLKLRVTRELGPAPVVGDPSLLDRLAGNLVENAVRYNLSESGVEPLRLAELIDPAELADVRLGYPPSRGSPELREAIAALYPDEDVDALGEALRFEQRLVRAAS
jgi:signal transduction histidine kinase